MVCVKSRTLGSFLQAVGAACLLVVVLTHVSEALRLFPFMPWGEEDSAGHYLDLASGVSGVTLFPLGFIWHAAKKRPHNRHKR
jgi:succinate dehydrogenase/fumarate reductase cytochrome b subunit